MLRSRSTSVSTAAQDMLYVVLNKQWRLDCSCTAVVSFRLRTSLPRLCYVTHGTRLERDSHFSTKYATADKRAWRLHSQLVGLVLGTLPRCLSIDSSAQNRHETSVPLMLQIFRCEIAFALNLSQTLSLLAPGRVQPHMNISSRGGW